MASVRLDIAISASAAKVWDTVRDAGAVHERFVPGFVTDTKLNGNLRTVTFATGFVAEELIVNLDDETMRLAYSVRPNELMSHHHASFQVVPEDKAACRLIWQADFLPNQCASSRQEEQYARPWRDFLNDSHSGNPSAEVRHAHLPRRPAHGLESPRRPLGPNA